jgi:NAD(P)H-hydrate epimerase
MIPVVTPDEMAGVDRQAPEPVEVLIERAGYCVARTARRMLGGAYGRRINVIAGRGNNGADGRAAARVLAAWGASVRVTEAGDPSAGGPAGPVERGRPGVDLVVDAAYGTGLSRPYAPPDPQGAPVLAVDIPSGLSGLTGHPVRDAGGAGDAVRATRTVTFAAWKPGLLLGEGPDRTGPVEVADIGLASLAETAASAWLVTDADVAVGWRPRPRNAHKWQSAVQVVAGSADMHGAPWLVASGALRAGAGYARVGIPGAPPGGGLPPGEQVTFPLPGRGWHLEAAEAAGRVQALVVGPGLGDPDVPGKESSVARLLEAAADVPAVVDADAIRALADLETVAAVARSRRSPMVLTPHDGEYARLTGHSPGEDRLADVRAAAAAGGAIVLLKGSVTVVAAPDGRALLVNAGSSRLASAGTGDVLSGTIGAFLARGLPPLDAAALAAHVHGRAASLGPAEGLVASDLPALVSRWLSGVVG